MSNECPKTPVIELDSTDPVFETGGTSLNLNAIWYRKNSDGEWVKQGDLMGTSTQSFTVPVIPRRCDHMQIRLKGSGDVKIYSLAKILEIGSDG